MGASNSMNKEAMFAPQNLTNAKRRCCVHVRAMEARRMSRRAVSSGAAASTH